MVKLLPSAEHAAHPWRIHDIAQGFRVENLWAIDTPGAGADDFPTVLQVLMPAANDDRPPFTGTATSFRVLLRVRQLLGRVMRWDAADANPEYRLLRDQRPTDPQDDGPATATGFASMSLLDIRPDEAAFEFVNKIVHGVMHLGWVRTPSGDWELQMAEMTKPNGRLGRTYLAAIAPFRRLIAVPALLRHWERTWSQRDSPSPSAQVIGGHGVMTSGTGQR